MPATLPATTKRTFLPWYKAVYFFPWSDQLWTTWQHCLDERWQLLLLLGLVSALQATKPVLHTSFSPNLAPSTSFWVCCFKALCSLEWLPWSLYVWTRVYNLEEWFTMAWSERYWDNCGDSWRVQSCYHVHERKGRIGNELRQPPIGSHSEDSQREGRILSQPCDERVCDWPAAVEGTRYLPNDQK